MGMREENMGVMFVDVVEAAAETVISRYRDNLPGSPNISSGAKTILLRRRRLQGLSRPRLRNQLVRQLLDVSNLGRG
jgi:hypothetical protein